MFTDVSSGFLEAARKRFAQRTSIEYAVLDITRDPLSEEIEPERHDLIVAANQGFLPGWWVGENDERVEKPYVNVDRWRKELLGIGLSGVDFTTHQFNESIVNMVSTRPIPPAAPDKITLLVSEHESGAATEVSRQFRSHGNIVELWGLYNPSPNSRFMIVLLDVVSPLLYNLDEEGFQQLKDFILGLSNHHVFGSPGALKSAVNILATDRHMVFYVQSTGRGKEYALVKGVIHTVRLQSVPATQELTKPIDNKLPKKLSLEFIGLLDTLVWREHRHSLLGDDEVEINVRCVGLNFTDIAISYGLFGYTEDLGYEGSGVVYATVGREEKVQYLVNECHIPRSRIFYSRDTSFHRDLMRETNNRGVDIVLSPLPGKLLHAPWKCVAPGGKMFDIGKRDVLGHSILPMNSFDQARSFYTTDLLQVMQSNLEQGKGATPATEIAGPYADFLDREVVHANRITCFDAADAASAFRYMQSGKHIGKIVIRIPEDAADLPTATSLATPEFSSEKAYQLSGGLGGLGQSIAKMDGL
ncbi:hypothetical protein BO85DRAFT_519879 [Aspergillus piperis CBS 112811]|uniref:Enoyl reductase (ER) domain-containing protein n=1 Tax=Aspergillus piperis CBS 112811 TaxID=1448313 RepID=A0A8G1R495_9EURO|nr:hypothetical protein BO85DRAFT_519879 [Aspergillus piperis CBS 112811]RAH57989.1 hypothetical protein BO85DRAFT_519879 [Aspergillus piperis CBS 112811]